jgi:hypothetical protein
MNQPTWTFKVYYALSTGVDRTQVFFRMLQFSVKIGRHNISLELRVKKRLLRYPEDIFFNSQGIPVKGY